MKIEYIAPVISHRTIYSASCLLLNTSGVEEEDQSDETPEGEKDVWYHSKELFDHVWD